MAEFWWPCPKCGQQQRKQTQQGEAPESFLCPACEEAEEKQRHEEFAKGKGTVGKAHR